MGSFSNNSDGDDNNSGVWGTACVVDKYLLSCACCMLPVLIYYRDDAVWGKILVIDVIHMRHARH